MFSKRTVETPHLIMITTYTNMTCHEYQGMFDIALVLKNRSIIFVLRYKRVRRVDYLSRKRSKYSGEITMLFLKKADKLYFCILYITRVWI